MLRWQSESVHGPALSYISDCRELQRGRRRALHSISASTKTGSCAAISRSSSPSTASPSVVRAFQVAGECGVNIRDA